MHKLSKTKSKRKKSLEKLKKAELYQLRDILKMIVKKQEKPPLPPRRSSLRPIVPPRTSSLNWKNN